MEAAPVQALLPQGLLPPLFFGAHIAQEWLSSAMCDGKQRREPHHHERADREQQEDGAAAEHRGADADGGRDHQQHQEQEPGCPPGQGVVVGACKPGAAWGGVPGGQGSQRG